MLNIDRALNDDRLIHSSYYLLPKKTPKGKELTADAKAWNRIVSGVGVLVEHVIGGVKRFGIASDNFRNRKDGFGDKVMWISCGLWNYSSVVLLD